MSQNGTEATPLDIEHVEKTLGYSFENIELLISSLTRRSYWHENRQTCSEHNERLEYLGDAVLGLVVAEILYNEFPEEEEGELQKRRASMVNRAALACLMRKLGLAPFIRMGRGDELSGCRDRDSVLADTLEAVIAAVYLDGGFDSARAMIKKYFYPLIEQYPTREGGAYDYKSQLQEWAQAELGVTPHYRVVDEWGEDHDKTFSIAVIFGDVEAGRGSGRNKKEAAQYAAREALERIFDVNEEDC